MKEKLLPVLLLVACDYGSVLFCVIADLISGIRKSRSKGTPCTSFGLRRTVDKLSRYYLTLFGLSAVDLMIVISMLILADKAPVPPFPFLTSFGALCLALIEIKSILETADEKRDIRRTAAEILSRLKL
ncbi:MAG: hypothetical protein K2K55_06390 [Duncaniella sp.]|nr:hypothetical protein [Duncaniella sp.]